MVNRHSGAICVKSGNLQSGRGIYQEILRRRIEHAKKLLARSDMLLSEIALECGMEWGGELTRIFKKLTGETPSQYRKAHTLKKG